MRRTSRLIEQHAVSESEPRSHDRSQWEVVIMTFSMTVSACTPAHPALPSPLMHRPIPTQQANANASPTLANRHLHPSEAHAQTHRSAGRIPQPCHATSNANHTHKQTLVPPMQAKLHCRRSRAWPNDKTHDANCRHQPMTSLDLRTFCNVRL